MTLIEEAHAIFNRAYEEHEPKAVFLLTSGGNDSAVPLHLFKDDPRVTAAVHIDTGIKVPEVEPHVQRVCDQYGLKLLVYRAVENTQADGTPDPQVYEEIIRKHGFPGPAQHSRMYSQLKERQLRRLVREHKTGKFDRIMLVTGVRRQESRRRMGYVEETQRFGSNVWVAPVANWTNEDMRVYRETFEVPTSPVSAKLGMSGECLCGAFAKPGEMARLEEFFPEVAAKIRDLERRSNCPWGWEGQPPRHLVNEVEAEPEEPLMLCTSCIVRGKAA
jgi:3'-phosphoadenosine 5'-phosphosulfate sulfotransferase (PAPS reductase)/FAD synthetase